MENSTITSPRLLKATDAAAYLAVSERKLWSMSKAKKIPVVRLGRSVRYDISDLDGFISRAKDGGGKQ